MSKRIKIVVVGGGPSGISVISAVRQWPSRDKLQITLVEPSDWHCYQSSWIDSVLIPEKNLPSRRHIGELLSPDEINWVNEAAGEFCPDNNYLLTETGKRINYDYLVVACGLQQDWERILGIHGKLGREGITSSASYSTLGWTKTAFSEFNKGKVIFTEPNTLNNMHSASKELLMRLNSRLSLNQKTDSTLTFYSGSDELYPIETCQNVLKGYFEEHTIGWKVSKELVEVRPKAKIAVFHDLVEDNHFEEGYDFLHIVPPMKPPIAVAQSLIADEDGLVDVDPHTMQHRKYTNIFALGDVTSIPVVRCISAVRAQMPVLVSNMAARILGNSSPKKYDGTNNQLVMVSERQAFLFRCKFMEHENLPFSYGLSENKMVAGFKNSLSSLLYWNYLLSGKSSLLP